MTRRAPGVEGSFVMTKAFSLASWDVEPRALPQREPYMTVAATVGVGFQGLTGR